MPVAFRLYFKFGSNARENVKGGKNGRVLKKYQYAGEGLEWPRPSGLYRCLPNAINTEMKTLDGRAIADVDVSLAYRIRFCEAEDGLRILHKAVTVDPLITESHSDITPLDNLFVTVDSQTNQATNTLGMSRTSKPSVQQQTPPTHTIRRRSYIKERNHKSCESFLSFA